MAVQCELTHRLSTTHSLHYPHTYPQAPRYSLSSSCRPCMAETAPYSSQVRAGRWMSALGELSEPLAAQYLVSKSTKTGLGTQICPCAAGGLFHVKRCTPITAPPPVRISGTRGGRCRGRVVGQETWAARLSTLLSTGLSPGPATIVSSTLGRARPLSDGTVRPI